jgi:flagellar motor protein MotB
VGHRPEELQGARRGPRHPQRRARHQDLDRGPHRQQGLDKFNKTLSQKRVDSVKKYLVEQGKIDGARLEPIGHGESKPLGGDKNTNKTADGRAANRRVEFNLKDCQKKIQ